MASEPTSAEWADHFASNWSRYADQIERQLAVVDPALFTHAAVRSGDDVVDVGCGRGPTTSTAAALAGPSGSILGIDLAGPLVTEAAQRHRDTPGAPIQWIAGDAQRHDFASDAADLVLSRFGTLFFDDPVAAFANLRRATRPTGRLAIAVWDRRDRSELHARPLAIALAACERFGHRPTLPGPVDGPFAFGDLDHARDVVTAAGWSRIDTHHHRIAFYAGDAAFSAVEAAEMIATIGSPAIALANAPPEIRPEVVGAIAADLETCRTPAGIRLDGRISVITAAARSTWRSRWCPDR